jgi:hypothetical protein
MVSKERKAHGTMLRIILLRLLPFNSKISVGNETITFGQVYTCQIQTEIVKFIFTKYQMGLLRNRPPWFWL